MSLKAKSEAAIQLTTPEEIKIGIVTSKWNSAITDKLKSACLETLHSHGLSDKNIITVDVPGTYELPYGARLIENHFQPDAIICLGCVIKGETDHDVYINQSTATTLQSMGVMIKKPVVFGVLTVNTEDQALDRSGGTHGHKGIESAETALELIMLDQTLSNSKKKIGFYAN